MCRRHQKPSAPLSCSLRGRARSSTPTPDLICNGPNRTAITYKTQSCYHAGLSAPTLYIVQKWELKITVKTNIHSFSSLYWLVEPNRKRKQRCPVCQCRPPPSNDSYGTVKKYSLCFHILSAPPLFFRSHMPPDFSRLNCTDNVCFFFRLYV